MKPFVLILALLWFAKQHAHAQGNGRKPRITGQSAITTNEDQPITILMSYLQVQDADNWFYPWGFTMQLYAGENYTVEGHVVTPAVNFHGTLTVPVTVNDGLNESNMFNLVIAVNPVNDIPVITNHVALQIDEGQTLQVTREHLTVDDPDNNYPDDFTLFVHPGDNYTVSGDQITSHPGFAGALTVYVSVSDGTDVSALYPLPVTVKKINRIPVITGQTALRVREDESLILLLSHLSVTDEDNNYPHGFSLNVIEGSGYSVSGTTITPAADFNGRLTVPVTVNDGTNTSNRFNLAVTVTPVDDIPVLTGLETEPVHYTAADELVALTGTLEVKEVDGDSIMFAEVGIRQDTYQVSIDQLVYTPASGSAIRGAFDPETGVLTLLGRASPEHYAEAIRAVRYRCLAPSREMAKTIFFSVNDGKTDSEEVVRQILFGQVVVSLDIPSGFTPNGDMANDTWKIIPLKAEEEYATARIRVYNKEGVVVYESIGFDNEWDGRYNGELLPADTYFYTIDLNINAPEGYLKGLVTILR